MDTEQSDGLLVGAVLQGNKEAYGELVNRYKQKVYGLLRGMGADRLDAQDVTQETFLKAYRGLGGHDRSRSFAAWLYTIAANTLRDKWKRSRPDGWAADPARPQTEKSAEDYVLMAERRSELRERLMQLPDNYRLVLLLRYTNDLTYEEISQVMNVPVKKVQNDLHRAKRRMRTLMAEEVTASEMLNR